MKKIYAFLMLLVMTAMCVTASAKTFTITVDDRNHIGYAMLTSDYKHLTFTTDNKVEFEAETTDYLVISAASGYQLASVVDGENNSLAYNTPSETVQVELAALGDGNEIKVTTSEKEMKVFTFTGDERLTVSISTWETGDVQYPAENGVFTVPMPDNGYNPVTISSEIENLAIRKVVADNGHEHLPNSGTVSIYSYEYSESTHFTIETYNPDEARTASMTVKVNGSADNVVLSRSDNTVVTLNSNGETIVKFDPENETLFTIRSDNYNKPIYQVKQNDERVDASYGTYYVTVNDGDVLEITPDFPDVDVPVTFTFTNKGTEDVVSYIMVDNQNKENWKEENLSVKLGSSISVKLNYEDYDIASFVVNGVSQYGFSYEEIVTSEDGLEFVVTASKKAPKYVTINCDNYENIIVYKGSYMDETYELTGPTTEIVVEPSVSLIQISPIQDWVISFIEDNTGNTYNAGESIYVSDGMELAVGVKKLERDRNLIVYIGGEDADWTYRGITLSSTNYDIRKEYYYNAYTGENTLPLGYTTIAFADFDCPISVNGATVDYSRPIVYLNGQLCEEGYYGYEGLDGELQDGDVLKMFPAEPATYAVTYSIEAEVDVEVVHDHSHAIAVDAAVVHNVLEGTEVWIKAVDEIVVTVNGEDITANEEGVYTFAINEDATVKVISNIANGILDLNAKVAGNADIYNLQGIRVGRVSDASRLPAGVYIINGQKVRF